jgi:cytochrome c peroxidase
VINSAGEETTLYKLMDDKITLLSFMYTSCGDINGCPLASHVLNTVMQRLTEDSRLSDRVQLLSFSFDRLKDSPEVLDIYASRFKAEKTENWQFVTAVNDFELERLLAEYNQFVIRDMNENGEYIGSISHLLRVYLIDPSKNLREVYSVSFLHPDIIINDISTILANDPQAK